MSKLNIKLDSKNGYYIKPADDPTYMEGRQAFILFREEIIGIFGVIHPQVLLNFEWPFPTSVLEINLEPLIKAFFE